MLKGNARVRLGLAAIGLLGAVPAMTGCQSVVASTLPPPKHHVAVRHAAGLPAQVALATLIQPASDVPAPSVPLATEIATVSPTDAAATSATDAAAPSGTLDLGGLITGAKGIARGADRIGVEIPALRRAVAIGAQALFGIGVLNAVLLFGILQTLRASLRVSKELRDAVPARAVVSQPPQPAKPAKPAIEADVALAPRTCECGERISSRSQSGRCRGCANAVRSSRARGARPKRRSSATLLGRPLTNGRLSPN